MSIVRTDKWLEEYFNSPVTICSKFLKEKNSSDFYRYLQQFGMYRPNKITQHTFQQLKKDDMWNKVQSIFLRYKLKWNGPDIPVFIFPLQNRGNLAAKRKSGLSFHDRMFLFLSPIKNEKDLEALIIHEYHHVCRLQYMNKPYEECTLLDSVIMEGLAEYSVKENLGDEYSADWVFRYKEKDLQHYWQKYFARNINLKRRERLHDVLLFGKGMYPDLIGYSVGYWLVNKIYQEQAFIAKESFTMDAKQLFQRIKETDSNDR